MTTHRRPLRHYLRSLYSWHRWLGVISALFVILLAVTGFVLNRSEDWRLDERAAPGWLRAPYDIVAPLPDQALEQDGHWFTAYEGWLYFDAARVTPASELSDVEHDSDSYRVMTDRGVVTLGAQGHPLAAPGQLIDVVEQPQARRGGNQDWRTPPAALAEALRRDAEGRALSWERVLLDLHSGRLFGRHGTLLMDVAAILFMVLALSGLTLWLRYHWRQRQRRLRRLPL